MPCSAHVTIFPFTRFPAIAPPSPQQPADSCDPTVDGPAAKRPRLAPAAGRGTGWGWGASAASCASDDGSDGEEAVSRKRPTPQKWAAPSGSGVAARMGAQPAPAFSLAARAAAAIPVAPRLAAQHPPPTWAQASAQAILQRGRGMAQGGVAAAAVAEDTDQVGAGLVSACVSGGSPLH